MLLMAPLPVFTGFFLVIANRFALRTISLYLTRLLDFVKIHHNFE
jgi:hypothetical protein